MEGNTLNFQTKATEVKVEKEIRGKK